MAKVLINAEYSQALRVAIVSNKNELLDYWVEYKREPELTGSVYLAKITSSYNPQLKAAFVDIGVGKKGFLPLDDTQVDVEALSASNQVLVQVTNVPKEGSKGPRLRLGARLQGRYCNVTYNPYQIESSELESAHTTDSLTKAIEDVLPETHFQVNVNRNAKQVADDITVAELEDLIETLQEVIALTKSPEAMPPVLLRTDSSLLTQIYRHHLHGNNKLIVDDLDTYGVLLRNTQLRAPEFVDNIEHYQRPSKKGTSLFSAHRIVDALKTSSERKVKLPDGANLVIESTEALTSIDVNSSKHRSEGTDSNSVMVKKVNIEAAKRIPTLLKLRDIGGLIVIDFIDMETDEDRAEVEAVVADLIAKDKARVEFEPISKFGLMTIARQRVGREIRHVSVIECDSCDGQGELPTHLALQQTIFDSLMTAGVKQRNNDADDIYQMISVEAAPEVINLISRDMEDDLIALHDKHRINVRLYANRSMHYPQYKVAGGGSRIVKPKEEVVDLFGPQQHAPTIVVTPLASGEVFTAREKAVSKQKSRGQKSAQNSRNKGRNQNSEEKSFWSKIVEAFTSSDKPAKNSKNTKGNRGGQQRKNTRGGSKASKSGSSSSSSSSSRRPARNSSNNRGTGQNQKRRSNAPTTEERKVSNTAARSDEQAKTTSQNAAQSTSQNISKTPAKLPRVDKKVESSPKPVDKPASESKPAEKPAEKSVAQPGPKSEAKPDIKREPKPAKKLTIQRVRPGQPVSKSADTAD